MRLYSFQVVIPIALLMFIQQYFSRDSTNFVFEAVQFAIQKCHRALEACLELGYPCHYELLS